MNIISEPEENYKTGWIRLFRSLENHWIWSNEKYLKTWIWFLFRANHKTSKILFSGELIELSRGEFLTSLKNISEAANLTVQETRHFLKLLEKDEMILKNSNTLATKITICKYESYQDLQQTNNKQTTNEQQTNNKPTTTDNNVKNNNNEKELKKYNKKPKVFTPPTILEVKQYFKENGYSEQSGEKAFNYYSVADWKDSKGNQVLNWKQKMQSVWFKPENEKINRNGSKGVLAL